MLEDLVKSYNNTKHSSTKFKPSEVNASHEKAIFRNLYGATSMREYLKRNNKKLRLRVDDNVRLPYQSGVFDRGFYPSWQDEVYKISNVNNSSRMYNVLDSSGRPIKGRVHEAEVQKIGEPLSRIEKVLKTRVHKGKKTYFVKWLNYSNEFNSWVDEISQV